MALAFNHRHLYYFWVVAKEGSMTRAAQRLDMAVQTVSAQVRELERDLGCQLLRPAGRGLALTDAGATYLHAVQRILADIDEADAAAASQRTLATGLLRLNAPLAYGVRRIAPLMPEFSRRHPAVTVELGLTDWAHASAGNTPPARGVDGVVALSGVYDLAPLVGTTLNTALGLDAASARRHSPLWRVGLVAPPALFGVGGAETPAFLAQNQAMADAWQAAGHPSVVHTVEDADHFTLLEHLVQAGNPLHNAVLALVDALPGV